ncbi:MAG: hypothetical protein KC589_02035 [Nanoarchaeota archaeon]|nr:hypothetical protein [Nanoarchaeota archaeon]
MVRFLFFYLFILIFFGSAFGINVTEVWELNSSNAELSGRFGYSVDISGNYVVIGAYDENGPLNGSGRVHIFKRNVSDDSFYEVDVLNSSNPEVDGKFGSNVNIDGNYIIVGAYDEDAPLSGSGRVYVFKRNITDDSFYEVDVLNSSNPKASGSFGLALGLNGDYIVVGAYFEDGGVSQGGRAYIFKRNVSDDSFYEIAVLNSSNPELGGRFGYSVDISGNYVVIGAQLEDAPLTNSGSVYVFKRNVSDDSFYQVAVLNSSNPKSSGWFGSKVNMEGNYIVVGAQNENAILSSAGRAYVFKRNVSDDSFYEIAVLNSSNPKIGGGFGYSVGIVGDYVIVGANNEDGPLSSNGRAYVFKRNTSDDSFYEVAVLNSSNAELGGNFGNSISIDGDYVIVGAHFEDAPLSSSGRAYVFKILDDIMENVNKSRIFPLFGIFSFFLFFIFLIFGFGKVQ